MDIAGAQNFVEFQRVEWHGFAIQEHQIAQMQVTVAAPHLPFGPAPVQQRRCSHKGKGRLGPKCRDLASPEPVVHSGKGVVQFRHDVGDQPRTAQIAPRCHTVIRVDALAQIFGQRVGKGTAIRDDGKFVLCRKTPHAQHPFHGFARTAQREAPPGRPGNRHNIPIDLWRGRPVQLQLAPQHRLAPRQCGQIHVVVSDRPLDFQGNIACKEDQRAMRLHQTDRTLAGMVRR